MAVTDIEQGNGGLDLYTETRQAIQGAFLMFFLPDVREMARQGQLSKSDPEIVKKVVDLPVNAWELIQILEENWDEIIATCIHDEQRAEMYRGAVIGRSYLEGSLEERRQNLEGHELVYFEDSNSENDLVWGLAVNKTLKRVTVAFRGSVTKKDFEQDAKAFFSPIPNPVKSDEDESERDAERYPEIANRKPSSEIRIHRGFREYLYGEEDATWLNSWLIKGLVKKQSQVTIANLKKYKSILEATTRIMDENPGFQLYVVGHSLGGALATLFAFEAAAAPDADIPKPVTCITTGAPKVGNLDFLQAFETLEELRKIRCLRVTNYRDIVPLAPPNGAFSFISACFLQARRFRHVGMRLKLLPDGRFLVSYPPQVKTCLVLWKRRYTYRLYRNEHTQLAYTNRFDECKEDLEELSLDQLYEERIRKAKWRLPIAHTSNEYYRWCGRGRQEAKKNKEGAQQVA